MNITMTVHKMFFRNALANEVPDRGLCFLVLDVAVVNDAELSYTFNSALTTVCVEAQSGYGRALASFIEMPGIREEGHGLAQARQICRYDALTNRLEGGMVGEAEIAAKGMTRGLLVYRVPVQADDYVFEYASGDIQIAIPFRKG